jgi:hypothetical protein
MSDSDMNDFIKVAPAIMLTMPILMLRVVVAYMRVKRGARRAVKGFKRGVKSEGLPPEVAKMLWKTYDDDTGIFRRLASSAMGGFAFVPK